AITFDTLAYAKKFIAAGFTQQQAEVQAETFAEIIDEQVATKQDLKEMEISLRRDMAEMKADIIKWVAAMLIAQAAIVATLVKLL
ncbi:MAG: DUF1640 domain-containing protein, partial [Bacteroidota bacterium]